MSANLGAMRAYVGTYFHKLHEYQAASWIDGVSMKFPSDQDHEVFKWLGMSPMLGKWTGSRKPQGLRDEGVTIYNEIYDATLGIPIDTFRRDKTGQTNVRIAELARQSTHHWAKLLTAAVVAGATTACHDGQLFFDTDHVSGASGTQDNDLTRAIVAAASPTAAEAEVSIMTCVESLLGYLNDQGEPMNEDLTSFLCLVPINYLRAFAGAVHSEVIVASSASHTALLKILGETQGFKFAIQPNVRLTATDTFYVFAMDGDVKPLIRLEEYDTQVYTLGPESEYAKINRECMFTVEASRGVGYGYWQRACMMVHTTA